MALAALASAVLPCHADVITDWDAKASAVASPAALGERELAIVDIAMFDAVNSISSSYRPYLVRDDGFTGASAEVAAASAAASALELLHPQSATEFKAAFDEYLKTLPATDGDVAKGIRLGELVAQRIFDSRAADGADRRRLLSPAHATRRVCTHGDDGGWYMAEAAAIRA